MEFQTKHTIGMTRRLDLIPTGERAIITLGRFIKDMDGAILTRAAPTGDGKHAGVISVGGLLLAKIPNETVEERNAYFRQRAQEQLHAVDNEMMRENAHSSMRIQSPERSSRTTFRQSNS